jgi:hypothetical protein
MRQFLWDFGGIYLKNKWEKWEKTRSRGMLHFVLFRGVLAWGGCMSIYNLVNHYLNNQISFKKVSLSTLITLFGGLIWGVFVWFWIEWKYKKEHRRIQDSGKGDDL